MCIRDSYEPYTESPARATGNDLFDNHPGCNDWYETVKLNYGVDYCEMCIRDRDDFIPIINKAHGKAIVKETAVIPNIFTITSYYLV